MQKREVTQEEIETAIFNQKERYNEQLGRLYQVVSEYRQLSGIDPITGRKSQSLQTVVERENAFLKEASRDGVHYPLVRFEDALLQCIDRHGFEVRDLLGAERFNSLLNSTSVVGHRFLLLECLSRIRVKEVWKYLYSNGLISTLLRYLKENGDIVTDYEFVFTLLSLLKRIPTPTSLQLQSFPNPHEEIRIALATLVHCGDYDLEELAAEILQRF